MTTFACVTGIIWEGRDRVCSCALTPQPEYIDRSLRNFGNTLLKVATKAELEAIRLTMNKGEYELPGAAPYCSNIWSWILNT